ncbi:hypothetical protein FRX31_009982 [Thalictrum thalictroides]|uniref:Transmembrane protein n=1 Tax=Thalictrum thalictroides TaxID=46969 RepID=A0A7J6WSS4_THATH|nr:hypothetical protein FRX31_009982 [Thalictrum thalictroides]
MYIFKCDQNPIVSYGSLTTVKNKYVNSGLPLLIVTGLLCALVGYYGFACSDGFSHLFIEEIRLKVHSSELVSLEGAIAWWQNGSMKR